MPDRNPVADQPQLTDEAQDVVHQRGTDKDSIRWWQTFQTAAAPGPCQS
jgi:hypothetical protein